MGTVYRIKDWEANFENNRTRGLKKLDWVPIPNHLDGDGYTELVSHANGAAHLGAWIALVQLASKCPTRGTLMRRGGKPHDIDSLARITRLGHSIFDEAIPRLLEIGWLMSEVVVSTTDATSCGVDAGIRQDDAGKTQETVTEGKGREGNLYTPPADEEPDCKPALQAFEEWSSVDRGQPLDDGGGESRAVTDLVYAMHQAPPVIRDGKSVNCALLIPLATELVRKRHARFEGAKYAATIIRNELEKWQRGGIPGTGKTATGPPRKAERSCVGVREDK